MKRFMFLATLLCFAPLCDAQPSPEFDSAKLAQIPQKMSQLIAADEIAGAVTLVATRDRVVHLDAVGLADVAGNTPMRTDSVFWIASMTKPITGAAIMMLQDQGKLSLDDPVERYIPEFAQVKTPSGKPANLTIKQLLTHTSGLAEVSGKPAQSFKQLADLIPTFINKPSLFEPGSQWKYCQSGIHSLGRIIEVVSGQSYPDFINEKFLQPLGMKDTTFYPTADQLSRLAKSYARNNETGKLEETSIRQFSGVYLTESSRVALPNAGLFSTAPDYARFAQMLLNGGTFEGKTYLKPETVKVMTSNLTGDLKAGFSPGHGWGCACGVVTQPQRVTAMLSPGTFGHGGAYGTQCWIDPVKGVVYVLMVQRSNLQRNGDDNPVRLAFQQTAAEAMK
jgi:CubicO group peptidase (beta-lactamase class C family)